MSRKYDSKTTTFTPEGRLQQIEYAMEAINKTGSSIGKALYLCRYRNQRGCRISDRKARGDFLVRGEQGVIENIPNRQAYLLCSFWPFRRCQLLD